MKVPTKETGSLEDRGRLLHDLFQNYDKQNYPTNITTRFSIALLRFNVVSHTRASLLLIVQFALYSWILFVSFRTTMKTTLLRLMFGSDRCEIIHEVGYLDG